MVSNTTECARVLVPAFAQPGFSHDERVGCIGVTPQGRFVRLYPWRFRQLQAEQHFACGDLIEYQTAAAGIDRRPETRYVDTRSVRVVQRAAQSTAQQRAQPWMNQPRLPMADLQQAHVMEGTSLGLVRPDEGSLQLHLRRVEDSPAQCRLQEAYRQVARAVQPALAHQSFEHELSYRFTSAGHRHELKLMDWEAQAACLRYQRRHADPEQALSHLRHKYERRLPALYLHLVVSTVGAGEFAIVGLLCHGVDLEGATRAAPVRAVPFASLAPITPPRVTERMPPAAVR